MTRHTITNRELQNVIIEQQLARSIELDAANKQLLFKYDIGRKRLTYVVTLLADGAREYAYDTLEEAIAAYNDL